MAFTPAIWGSFALPLVKKKLGDSPCKIKIFWFIPLRPSDRIKDMTWLADCVFIYFLIFFNFHVAHIISIFTKNNTKGVKYLNYPYFLKK